MAKRGNLVDVGNFQGFTEGYIRVDRSVFRIHKFKGDAATPFFGLVWDCTKLTKEWEPMGDGDDAHVEISFRLGDVANAHPGVLKPADFDNADADVDDQGGEVGAEGNCVAIVDGGKGLFSPGWNVTRESMEKKGFSPAKLKRGIATDFVGSEIYFTSKEGTPYIAKSGKQEGQKVTPKDLIAEKFNKYGYEVQAKGGVKTATTTSAPAGANGKAEETASDAVSDAAAAMASLDDKFFTEVPKGKAVDRLKFQKEFTNALIRAKMILKDQKRVLDVVKNEKSLKEIAEATELFTISDDGKQVTFSA